jgi:hypothetical protein
MSLSERPGLIVSSAVHVGLLAAMLLSFSFDPKFQDAQETIPVEIMTSSDLNQIMHGEKTAKQVQPKPRVDKVSDTTEDRPKPPLNEAKKDVLSPPSPDKKLDQPGQADKPAPKPDDTAQPQKAAQLPDKVPPKPTIELPPKPDQDATDPVPVPRPKVEQKEAKKDEPKKPDTPKLKLDQVAKLLQDQKVTTPPKPAREKSGDENPDKPRKFDPNDISRLLSHEDPQRRASTGRELQQLASLGTETANAPKMSPSLMAQMEGWFQDRFQGCWIQPITAPPGPKYVPEIRVPLNIDGSLADEPTLLNPPNDPAWRPLAESALRAIRKCDPLPVPAQFKPYYDEWRGRIVRFNDDIL